MSRIQDSVARLVICVAIGLSLIGCEGSPSAQGQSGAGAAPPPPEVGVVTISPRAITLRTELPGRTVPSRIAEVRPQVSGIVIERAFQEGGEITTGQVLYRIDPAPYRAVHDSAVASLARSRAILERAELRAERYAKLAESRSVSREDNDDAQAALKEARASLAVDTATLERARIDLAYTEVRSPIDGRIGRSTVTQGALVTANQDDALAIVQQLDPIYVDMTQSSTQLLRLRRALADGRLERPEADQASVNLILEDGRSYPHTGRIEFSEVTVDEDTGTVTLRATIPNPEAELLPGMFVRASVEEGVLKDAILIPQQAVRYDRRGKPTALVVTAGDTVEERPIETERSVGVHWLVNAGLTPGERVIVEGVQKARPGAPVRVLDMSDDPRFVPAP